MSSKATSNVATVRSAIIEAFSGVELGHGIGLWESQAIDDYADAAARERARKKDERYSWQSLLRKDLAYAGSCLSFVDPQGMRFLLPACMVASMDLEFGFDPVFHLTRCYDEERFAILSGNQRAAVRLYLEWARKLDEFEFERSDIDIALEKHWSVD